MSQTSFKLHKISTTNYKHNKIKEQYKNIKTINPQLNIIDVVINHKHINVIQDGDLICGTKQRVAELFVKEIIKTEHSKNKIVNTIVYAGTFNGYGAIASAFASKRLNIKCKVYLSLIGTGFTEKSDIDYVLRSKQLQTLVALNAQVYLCSDYRKAKNLLYSVTDIHQDHYILPMGLNDKDCVMINLLSIQIKNAMKGTLLESAINPTIWMVAGSGGILMALNKALQTKCKIKIHLTGGGKYIKRVKEYVKKCKNIIIVNKENDKNEINNNIYYDTVKNYDDKIVQYVKKYGKDGDFIWNVAAD